MSREVDAGSVFDLGDDSSETAVGEGAVALEGGEEVLALFAEAVSVGQVLLEISEQGGVDLRVIRRFPNRELGDEGIEFYLDALQEDRVLHLLSRAVHDQDPIREEELILFRLTLEPAPEVEESRKDCQRLDGLLLPSFPFLSQLEPVVEGVDPLLGAVESL